MSAEHKWEVTAKQIAELVREGGVAALESAAYDAMDRNVGMDSHAARAADDRGFMQRHNVSSAARWLRRRAEALRVEA